MPNRHELFGLRQQSFFTAFSEEEWKRVAAPARHHALGDGERFIEETSSESPIGVYYVADGELGVTVLSPEGRSLCVRTLHSGEMFFSPSLFDGLPCPATLESIGHARVWFIPDHAVLPILVQSPRAARAAFSALAARLREAQEIIEALAFKGNTSRLAALLLLLADDRGRVDRSRYSLEFLASRINTVPEVISRLLHQLGSEGVLHISRTRIEVLDRPALRDLAQG